MRHLLNRRHWLTTAVGATASSLALGAQVSSKSDRSKLGIPGLFPGRVVQVEHPGSIVFGEYQAALKKVYTVPTVTEPK